MAQSYPTLEGHKAHEVLNGWAQYSVEYVPLEDRGEVVLEICDECKFIKATCTHAKNSWNKEETNLTCILCGIDGT